MYTNHVKPIANMVRKTPFFQFSVSYNGLRQEDHLRIRFRYIDEVESTHDWIPE